MVMHISCWSADVLLSIAHYTFIQCVVTSELIQTRLGYETYSNWPSDFKRWENTSTESQKNNLNVRVVD